MATVTKKIENSDGITWFEIDGTDIGTAWEFNNDIVGVTDCGLILDCDGCPCTVGDLFHIAVTNAFNIKQKPTLLTAAQTKRFSTMTNLKLSSVTEIQFFDCTRQVQIGGDEHIEEKHYSANIIVDDRFVIQLSGNEDEAHSPTIPTSSECFHNDEELQDRLSEQLSTDDVIEFLEREEIENNFHYLYENADLRF